METANRLINTQCSHDVVSALLKPLCSRSLGFEPDRLNTPEAYLRRVVDAQRGYSMKGGGI